MISKCYKFLLLTKFFTKSTNIHTSERRRSSIQTSILVKEGDLVYKHSVYIFSLRIETYSTFIQISVITINIIIGVVNI